MVCITSIREKNYHFDTSETTGLYFSYIPVIGDTYIKIIISLTLFHTRLIACSLQLPQPTGTLLLHNAAFIGARTNFHDGHE